MIRSESLDKIASNVSIDNSKIVVVEYKSNSDVQHLTSVSTAEKE
jgi:hypothetical protein